MPPLRPARAPWMWAAFGVSNALTRIAQQRVSVPRKITVAEPYALVSPALAAPLPLTSLPPTSTAKSGVPWAKAVAWLSTIIPVQMAAAATRRWTVIGSSPWHARHGEGRRHAGTTPAGRWTAPITHSSGPKFPHAHSGLLIADEPRQQPADGGDDQRAHEGGPEARDGKAWHEGRRQPQ